MRVLPSGAILEDEDEEEDGAIFIGTRFSQLALEKARNKAVSREGNLQRIGTALHEDGPGMIFHFKVDYFEILKMHDQNYI